MNKIITLFLSLLFLLPLGFAQASLENVNIYEPDLSYDGFTLITPQTGGNGTEGNNELYLIDMDGEVAHTWSLDEQGTQFAEMLEDGTLLYRFNAASRPNNADLYTGTIQEIDWDESIRSRIENSIC